VRVVLEEARRLGRAARHHAPHDFAEVSGARRMQRLVRVDERDDPTEQRALVLAQRREHRVQLAAEDLARQVRVLELAPRVRVGGGGIRHERHELLNRGLGFQAA
jgi:uncharacterized DUF497 family protein